MKRIHIEIKADTLEMLKKVKEKEKREQFYNVTNDIVVRKALMEYSDANK